MRKDRLLHACAIITFLFNTLGPIQLVYAQDLRLPTPGAMVRLSSPTNPPIFKGIKVHPDNPFRFDFILDKGDGYARHPEGSEGSKEQLKTEATKLIKYFLASLTIPEKDLWVNLSPYEKDRIIPQSFGLTEMGRDLLAEDYMLKQITASLIYPEDETGKKFWKRIYEEAAKKFGTTNIPVNTFNKVWIVPQKAVVYENAQAGTAYVVESELKVMLEQDYLALEENQRQSKIRQPGDMALAVSSRSSNRTLAVARTLPSELGLNAKATLGQKPDVEATNALGSQIVREIIIPELTQEVNQGRNFAQLRQVYNSLILAAWYKKKIKDSILAQVYANKNKTMGVQYISTVIPAKAGIHFKNDIDGIYQEYLEAFKKGVYNYIRDDINPMTQETMPRKYFSGGVGLTNLELNAALTTTAVLPDEQGRSKEEVSVDLAMATDQAIKTPSVKPPWDYKILLDSMKGGVSSGDKMRSVYDHVRPQELVEIPSERQPNAFGNLYVSYYLNEEKMLENIRLSQQRGDLGAHYGLIRMINLADGRKEYDSTKKIRKELIESMSILNPNSVNDFTRSAIIGLQMVDPKGKVVVVAGAGDGILAIVAAKLGAKKVIVTDMLADALDLAKQNIDNNHVADKVVFKPAGDYREVDFSEDGIPDIIVANLPRNEANPSYPIFKDSLVLAGNGDVARHVAPELEFIRWMFVQRRNINYAKYIALSSIRRGERWFDASAYVFKRTGGQDKLALYEGGRIIGNDLEARILYGKGNPDFKREPSKDKAQLAPGAVDYPYLRRLLDAAKNNRKIPFGIDRDQRVQILDDLMRHVGKKNKIALEWIEEFKKAFPDLELEDQINLHKMHVEVLFRLGNGRATQELFSMRKRFGMAEHLVAGQMKDDLEEICLRYYLKGVHLIHMYVRSNNKYQKDREFIRPILGYQTHSFLGHMLLGQIYHDLGMYRRAKQEFERSMKFKEYETSPYAQKWVKEVNRDILRKGGDKIELQGFDQAMTTDYKAEREINEKGNEISAAKGMKARIDAFIEQTTVLVNTFRNVGRKQRMALVNNSIKQIRDIAYEINIPTTEGLGIDQIRELLKTKRLVRDSFEKEIRIAEQSSDKKMRSRLQAALNLELIKINKQIAKLQLLLAEQMLLMQVNPAPQFNAGVLLATLRGASNSLDKLKDELSIRRDRLRARQQIKAIYATNWMGEMVRTFKLAAFDINVVSANGGKTLILRIRKGQPINVHTQLDDILSLVRKGKISESLEKLDALIELYTTRYIKISKLYIAITEHLKALRKNIQGFQEGQIPETSLIGPQIETLKKMIIRPKIYTYITLEQNIYKAFDAFMHRFESYEDDIAEVSRNKAILEYFFNLMDTAQPLSEIKKKDILEGLERILSWAQRAYADPKQALEIPIRPAIENIKLGAFEDAKREIRIAVGHLEQRLKDIDRIVFYSKREAASIYATLKVVDINNRLDDILVNIENGQMEKAANDADQIREIYFGLPAIEPGYQRIRNTEILERLMKSIRAKTIDWQYVRRMIASIRLDIEHKDSLKIMVMREDKTAKFVFVPPGISIKELLKIGKRDPDKVRVSIGKGWINIQRFNQVLNDLSKVTISQKDSAMKPQSIVDIINSIVLDRMTHYPQRARWIAPIDYKANRSQNVVAPEYIQGVNIAFREIINNALDHHIPSDDNDKIHIRVAPSGEKGSFNIDIDMTNKGPVPFEKLREKAQQYADESHLFKRDIGNVSRPDEYVVDVLNSTLPGYHAFKNVSQIPDKDLVFVWGLSAGKPINKIGGAGIGLKVARNEMRKMGGDVRFKWAESNGVTHVTVSLVGIKTMPMDTAMLAENAIHKNTGDLMELNREEAIEYLSQEMIRPEQAREEKSVIMRMNKIGEILIAVAPYNPDEEPGGHENLIIKAHLEHGFSSRREWVSITMTRDSQGRIIKMLLLEPVLEHDSDKMSQFLLKNEQGVTENSTYTGYFVEMHNEMIRIAEVLKEAVLRSSLDPEKIEIPIAPITITELGKQRNLAALAGLPLKRNDSAMSSPTGGIDLSSNKALTVQNNGQGIKFHIDPEQLQQLKNAPGFTPVIINIQPITNLKQFLGYSPAEK